MQPADLGYEFHDNFSSFGLSADNTAASSATDNSIALVESLLDTLNKLIADADAFSGANKSDLETQDDGDEFSAAHIDDRAHRKRRKV